MELRVRTASRDNVSECKYTHQIEVRVLRKCSAIGAD